MVNCLHIIHICDFPLCISWTFTMPSLCDSSRLYVCLWHIHSWRKHTSLWPNSLLIDNMKYSDISDALTCVCYPVGSAVPHKWISSFPEGINMEGFKVFTLCVSVCVYAHWPLSVTKQRSRNKVQSVRVSGFTKDNKRYFTINENDYKLWNKFLICYYPSVFRKVNMKSKLSLFCWLSINHIIMKSKTK